MSHPSSPIRLAGTREAGACCPCCRDDIHEGTPVATCALCGTLHHASCWESANGCGSYACSPGRRTLTSGDEPVLRISTSDLENAVPLPERRRLAPAPAPLPPSKPRTSRLAIASLTCAVAGIPLFGVVTGPVAVLLGSLALGGIRHSQQKGTALAVTGVLLGLTDLVAWIVFLSWIFVGGGALLRSTQFVPDDLVLENLEPPVRRAMRANVLIESGRGLSQSIGSGVIMRISDGHALILTNRHVVDSSFAFDHPAAVQVDPGDVKQTTVMMVDQSLGTGKVIWLAPHGVDLALVRAPCDAAKVSAARWRLGRAPRIRDDTFAIGNPHGLGWTLTQGPISQFRIRECGDLRLRIIQTQTALNPGNSGGGLYDTEGYLIGINTWTQDKRVAEGLNFAIAIDALAEVHPLELDVRAGSE